MEIDENLYEDDDNFIVDDEGRAAKYEDEEINEENNKPSITGPLAKLIGNMQQSIGLKNSNKVDKKLVNAKRSNILNLMNEIGGEDEDDIPPKKNLIDYNKFNEDYNTDYNPAYSKKNIMNFNEKEEIDINMDLYKEKNNEKEKSTKKIIPIRVAKKDDTDNFQTFKPEHRTIKRNAIQKDDDDDNNYYSANKSINKSNNSDINMEYKDTSNFSYISFNKEKQKLNVQKDGSIHIYWYDAIDEVYNNKPNVIFFGKIYDPSTKTYCSISLIIKDIMRTVFILPKKEYAEKLQEVYKEFEELRKSRFSNIKEFKCKSVDKKYCFELPVESKDPKNPIHTVLKVKYKAEYGPIPGNLNAKTFDYIFGKKSSLLENILLRLKIKGPCWLKIKNYTEINMNYLRTWSNYEVTIEDFKNIQVLNDPNLHMPPLKILSISTQSIQNRNQSELYCICCALKDNYHVEDIKGSNNIEDFQHLIFCRLIDEKLCIYKNDDNEKINIPPDVNNIQKLKMLLKDNNIYMAKDEKILLTNFITKISVYDPDLIVGHNLNNKHLELILSRISQCHTPNWTKLSHFKRSSNPNHLKSANFKEYLHKCFSGRLLCDTFESSKEILLKETNYDLRTLCENHLNLPKLEEIEVSNILYNLTGIENIKKILGITMDEAYYTLQIMDKYQILPLTKQLTNIAGCLWIKAFECSRAARCEMLLLHNFYENNYLYPDKNRLIEIQEDYEDTDDDNDDDENNFKISRNQRRKPQYSGGLVLEPHPGLYDDIILVMDFNSLYPSIIQEYNISFETAVRKPTQTFYEENAYTKKQNKKNKKNKKDKNNKDNENNIDDNKSVDANDVNNNDDNEDENEDDDSTKVDIGSDKIRYKEPKAILPSILFNLVNSRKDVKNLLKKEKDKFKYSLLDIKQKALKVSANALYGYLGYKNSRFYAKEIAALVTSTGRRILKNAANIVNKTNHTIIYGDTDSVMVNTNTQNIKEAVKIGNELKEKISKQYKLLIMDIDGVFKSMLLLRKKKYACLKYLPPYNENSKVERELKGVDLVRRDWSPLSKNAGLEILNIILSGKPKDEIISEIYEKLQKVSKDIDENKIELKDFAITKQLAKSIDDYNDTKALPHVQVAKRLREKGIRIQINSFIPYIICYYKTDEENNDAPPHKSMKSISDRAYHPKEIENDKSLKVDIEWYKENQVLAVVKRLVQHIPEITMGQLCECLNIDYKQQDYQNNEIIEAKEENGEIRSKLFNDKVRFGLTILCSKCGKYHTVSEMMTRLECIRNIIKCPFCKNLMTSNNDYNYIANKIKYTIRNLYFSYYKKKCSCSKCRENSALFCRTMCPDTTCRGYMTVDYSEFVINNELMFLMNLVTNDGTAKEDEEKIFLQKMKNVQNYIKVMRNNISYENFPVFETFSFLNNKDNK